MSVNLQQIWIVWSSGDRCHFFDSCSGPRWKFALRKLHSGVHFA